MRSTDMRVIQHFITKGNDGHRNRNSFRQKRVRTAFAYIMHEDRPPGVPTMQYISTCMYGYRNFGFDTEILFDAVRRSRRGGEYEM